MTEERKTSIKNLIYFLLGLIMSIGLSIAFAIMIDLQLWSKEFYILCAMFAALWFGGYRSANLTKPFTISEYLQKRDPLELDMIAKESTYWAIIKRSRMAADEKKKMADLDHELKKITEEIENNKDIKK